MSMLWIAVLVVAGPTSELGITEPPICVMCLGDPPVEQPLVPPRNGRELAKAVQAALVRWAHAGEASGAIATFGSWAGYDPNPARTNEANKREVEGAVREFLALYKELDGDAGDRAYRNFGLTPAERAERTDLRAEVRGRLVHLGQLIAAAIARQSPVVGRQPLMAAPPGVPAGVLVRLLAPAYALSGGRSGGMDITPFAVLQQAPAGVALPGSGGPDGPNVDEGQKLLDLIETTIVADPGDVIDSPVPRLRPAAVPAPSPPKR